MLNDKRGFLDQEVLTSGFFIILLVLAVGATLIGWTMSKSWGVEQFPIWQLAIIIVAEFFAAYFFASRG